MPEKAIYHSGLVESISRDCFANMDILKEAFCIGLDEEYGEEKIYAFILMLYTVSFFLSQDFF